jgi:hypothetical protein
VFRQTELVHRANAGIDDAKNNVRPETLAHHAGAISSSAIGVSEIGVSTLLYQHALHIVQKGVG